MGWAMLALNTRLSANTRTKAIAPDIATIDVFPTLSLSIRYEPLYCPWVRPGFFQIPRFILTERTHPNMPFSLLSLPPEAGDSLLPLDTEADSPSLLSAIAWNWEHTESAKSRWGWDVSTSTVTLRPESDATLATRSPILLTLTRTIGPDSWESFRPMVSAGLGVLNQTREGRDYGERQREFLPIWHAGIGAEWEPSEDLILRFNYDYTQSPVESVLIPQLPTQLHSLQMGVELRF